MVLQETYGVQDCYKYDLSEYSFTSTHSSDTAIPVFNNFEFTSDSFEVEFDGKYGAGTIFGIEPSNFPSTLKHYIGTGFSSRARLTWYIGKETSGEDAGVIIENPSTDTWYHTKITKNGDTVTISIDGTQSHSSTRTYLSNKTWTFIRGEWVTNNSYSLKNLKIKAL